MTRHVEGLQEALRDAGTPREDELRGLRFPVVEMFGPTIQGEGPDAGRRCWFLRLGYCDYRCSWCDSMHAVDPARVREHPRMSPAEIVAALDFAPWPGDTLVLSGGNPVVHDLSELVLLLHGAGWRIAVETQGSIWRDWLVNVERLVISPKPPSSEMHTEERLTMGHSFLSKAERARGFNAAVLKVVVADRRDFEWARVLHNAYPSFPFYVSAMTDHQTSTQIDDDGAAYEHPPQTPDLRDRVGESYRELCELVIAAPDMRDVVALPQLHVIAWGAELGR